MSNQQGYNQQDYNPNYQQQQPQQQYQNYQQQSYQQNSYDEEAHSEKMSSGKPQSSEKFDDAFKIEKPKWNDWPFTVFFLLVVAGFIAIAVICLRAYKSTMDFQGTSIYNSSNSFSLNTNTVVLFGFLIVISIVLSICIILFARLAARIFITTGLILSLVFGLATCVYYFAVHYYSAGVVFLVFTLFNAFCYWGMRSRIPFSATVLEIIIDVMKTHPSTVFISILGTIVSGLFSVLFSVVLVAAYIKYDANQSNPGCSVSGGDCSQAKLIGVLVFLFFAGYYISEVIRNVIHVSISGVFGVWYYLSKSDQGEPKFPALGAFKRAMTYSFGSICFGSLIVSLIQLLRQLVNMLKNDAFNQGDCCQGCFFLCLDVIISVIDWMVRYFNHYAYSFVALYGKSYIGSAKDTWQLLKYKGIDALINDCLINTSLSLYCLLVSYIVTLFSFLYLRYTAPAYNDDGTYYAPVMAFGFLIAGQITHISLTTIKSGTATFFVALARDPEVFQASYRDRFDEVFRNYPNVLQKVMGSS